MSPCYMVNTFLSKIKNKKGSDAPSLSVSHLSLTPRVRIGYLALLPPLFGGIILHKRALANFADVFVFYYLSAPDRCAYYIFKCFRVVL